MFVKVGVEFTLERSQITRDHMGHLLYQLVQSEKLSKQDFFKGLVSSVLAPNLLGDVCHVASVSQYCSAIICTVDR